MLSAAFVSAASAAPAPPNESAVESLALEWFKRMETGAIDRTQLTPEYSAQLTDSVVQELSRFLKKQDWGATPSGAQVLLTRADGDQTFYVVKLIFPRGDAASLLVGFNHEGKITGINLMTMPGD
jgi:hypothetical protein